MKSTETNYFDSFSQKCVKYYNIISDDVWLTDIFSIEHNLLRFGRTMLVLSLDPNTNFIMVGKVFTMDQPIQTSPTDRMAVPEKQDESRQAKQIQRTSPKVSRLSCQMTKTRNAGLEFDVYSLFAVFQCRL